MTEFTVTNGTIEYTRTRKPADYEGQTPKVSLSFTVADGSDPEKVVAKVMAIAVNEVEAILTGKRVDPEPQAEAKKGKRVSPPTSPTMRSDGNSTPPPAQSDPTSLVIPSDGSTGTSTAVSTADPSKIEDDTPSAATPTGHALSDPASVDTSDAVSEPDDDLASLGIEPAEEPISDKDLHKVIQPLSVKLTEKRGSSAGQLRVLITEAGGTTLQSIPQENRKGFVEKCKGLMASL